MRTSIHWMLAMIVGGSVCSRSHGQTFNFRYDSHSQLLAEAAFDVEKGWSGGYVLFINSAFLDSLYYSSVTTSVRIDELGQILSIDRIEYPLHATYVGWANNAIALGQHGFAIAGTTVSQDTTQRPTLYFADTSGNFSAFSEYGFDDETWIGRQVKQTMDGGFIICGETSAVGIIDGFLLKTDSLGNQEWIQTYGLPNKRDYALTVDLGPNGGYFFGGKREITSSNYDQWVVRTDALGNIIWSNDYGTAYDDIPNAHVTTALDGNLLFASSWASGVIERHTDCLVKLDTSGGVIWSQTYDIDKSGQTLLTVKECINGDLIAAGQTFWYDGIQGALLRTNSIGDSLWMRYYYYLDSILTDGEGELKDVIQTDDGGFIAVGVAYGSASLQPQPYSQDVWVLKVDSMGCLVPGCDLSTGMQSQITNYRDVLHVDPNPASEVAQLSWALPPTVLAKGGGRLSVVSASGKLVRELPLDLASGSYALEVRDFPQGLYYLHVLAGGSWVMGAKVLRSP